MAGKTLFPTLGQAPGIQAGAPFQVLHFTYVEQVTPPFLATQRLAIVVDANQSIIAPGILSGAGSFVMGKAVVDAANGARAILIGDTIAVNSGGGASQADDQILIGHHITVPVLANNTQNLIVLGDNVTLTASGGTNAFGSTIIIGNGTSAICAPGESASNIVIVGAGASVTQSAGIAIGSGATVSQTEGIAIGQAALAGSQAVAIGARSNIGATSVGLGRSTIGGTDSISLGFGATTSGGDGSLAAGRSANTVGATAAMAFGRNATNTVSNWLLFGSRTDPILTMRIGAGLNDATGGRVYTWQTTDVFGGAGNNLQGNTLIVAAGVGTGNWANGQNNGLDFQLGIVGTNGSVQQVYTSVLAMRHSDLNVSFWGGLGAPFSGGAGVMFLKNATTNPTVAAVAGGGILSVQGGQLHFLSSGGVDTALTPGGGGGGTVSSAGMTAGTLPVATGAQAIGNSIVSQAAGVLTVAGGVISSDTPNTLDLRTVLDQVRLMPRGTATIFCARAADAPDGINQLAPSTTNSVALGGATRAFNGLFITGAVSITLTNQTTTVGASVGTLTNTPSAGNPTGYLQVNINGAVGKIPYWT